MTQVIDSREIRVESKPVVTGLPAGMYVEYFGQMPDQQRTFIIIRPRDNWEYSDFVCIIDGRNIPISRVTRYRDGGTTDIETDAGKFHFPTPFQKDGKATFNGLNVTKFEREYAN